MACATVRHYAFVKYTPQLVQRGSLGLLRSKRQVYRALWQLVSEAGRFPTLFPVAGMATILVEWQSPRIVIWFPIALFWVVLVMAIRVDVEFMTVPNWLTIGSAIVLVCVMSMVNGMGATLSGALTGVTTLLLVHVLSRGNMGLGDVKLFACIGAVVGWQQTVTTFLIGCVFGSAFGLSLRGLRKLPSRAKIPFVPFIAMGLVASQFFCPHLISWYENFVLHAVLSS